MMVLERAPYVPFTDPRMAHPPGLMPLDPAEWFVNHADFAAQMAYRERLLVDARDVVLAMRPEGQGAAVELLAAVVEHVLTQPGYMRDGRGVERPDGVVVAIDPGDPLATAGRLVADDLCVLLPDAGSGEYRLVAAALCFPSRWLLSEKIGRPLTAIHDPVPDYDQTLARRVNRVFEALRVGRPLWRVNWIVDATPELHLPMGEAETWVSRAGAADGLYLRTERQTLTRLPGSGAVIFGIKTSVSPIDSLNVAEAASLRAALLDYDPATIAYKSHNAYAAALDRLAEIVCQGGVESAS